MGRTNAPPSDLLTVAEVATYLRVSKSTVWRWCSSGRLNAFRIGRSWRVKRSDLEESMNHADGLSPISAASEAVSRSASRKEA